MFQFLLQTSVLKIELKVAEEIHLNCILYRSNLEMFKYLSTVYLEPTDTHQIDLVLDPISIPTTR